VQWTGNKGEEAVSTGRPAHMACAQQGLFSLIVFVRSFDATIMMISSKTECARLLS